MTCTLGKDLRCIAGDLMLTLIVLQAGHVLLNTGSPWTFNCHPISSDEPTMLRITQWQDNACQVLEQSSLIPLGQCLDCYTLDAEGMHPAHCIYNCVCWN